MIPRVITFAILLILFGLASADEITDRIKIGLTQEEVIAIMGENPSDSDCSSIIGIRSCKLFWKRASFDKNNFSASFYDVTLIADRVISTNSQTKQGTYK